MNEILTVEELNQISKETLDARQSLAFVTSEQRKAVLNNLPQIVESIKEILRAEAKDYCSSGRYSKFVKLNALIGCDDPALCNEVFEEIQKHVQVPCTVIQSETNFEYSHDLFYQWNQ